MALRTGYHVHDLEWTHQDLLLYCVAGKTRPIEGSLSGHAPWHGMAWADPFLWAPLQAVGSIGMLLGDRWDFFWRLPRRTELRGTVFGIGLIVRFAWLGIVMFGDSEASAHV